MFNNKNEMRNILEVIKQIKDKTDRDTLKESLELLESKLSDGFKCPNDYWFLLQEEMDYEFIDKELNNNDFEVLSIFTTNHLHDLWIEYYSTYMEKMFNEFNWRVPETSNKEDLYQSRYNYVDLIKIIRYIKENK